MRSSQGEGNLNDVVRRGRVSDAEHREGDVVATSRTGSRTGRLRSAQEVVGIDQRETDAHRGHHHNPHHTDGVQTVPFAVWRDMRSRGGDAAGQRVPHMTTAAADEHRSSANNNNSNNRNSGEEKGEEGVQYDAAAKHAEDGIALDAVQLGEENPYSVDLADAMDRHERFRGIVDRQKRGRHLNASTARYSSAKKDWQPRPPLPNSWRVCRSINRIIESPRLTMYFLLGIIVFMLLVCLVLLAIIAFLVADPQESKFGAYQFFRMKVGLPPPPPVVPAKPRQFDFQDRYDMRFYPMPSFEKNPEDLEVAGEDFIGRLTGPRYVSQMEYAHMQNELRVERKMLQKKSNTLKPTDYFFIHFEKSEQVNRGKTDEQIGFFNRLLRSVGLQSATQMPTIYAYSNHTMESDVMKVPWIDTKERKRIAAENTRSPGRNDSPTPGQRDISPWYGMLAFLVSAPLQRIAARWDSVMLENTTATTVPTLEVPTSAPLDSELKEPQKLEMASLFSEKLLELQKELNNLLSLTHEDPDIMKELAATMLRSDEQLPPELMAVIDGTGMQRRMRLRDRQRQAIVARMEARRTHESLTQDPLPSKNVNRGNSSIHGKANTTSFDSPNRTGVPNAAATTQKRKDMNVEEEFYRARGEMERRWNALLRTSRGNVGGVQSAQDVVSNAIFLHWGPSETAEGVGAKYGATEGRAQQLGAFGDTRSAQVYYPISRYVPSWVGAFEAEGFTLKDIPPAVRGTIFVSLASYRDVECHRTVRNILQMSSFPHRVYLGISHQHYRNVDDDCVTQYLRQQRCNPDGPRTGKTINASAADTEPFCFTDNIRMRYIRPKDARGPTYGRYMAMLLYRGEDYYFMLDSHSRFLKSWDTLIINYHREMRHPKAILSHYPPGYEATGVVEYKTTISNYLCNAIFLPFFGYVRLEGRIIQGTSSAYDLPQPWAAGGFLFAESSLLREVPCDPYLPQIFDGEEVLYSVRAWTHGYDIYSPHRSFVQHYYRRPGAPKFFQDVPWWPATQGISRRRIQFLLHSRRTSEQLNMTAVQKVVLDYPGVNGIPKSVPFTPERLYRITPHTREVPVLLDILRYGMGRVRNVDAWYRYSGANPFTGVFEKNWCGAHSNYSLPV